MPIQLTCACGKRLQVGDQYAGRKVSCPGCKSVLTGPGGATPAAAAPAAPKPASKPVPQPAPRPAPPPPPPPEPAPSGGDPFAFGAAGGDEEEEAPKPPPKKPMIVGSVGGKVDRERDEPKAKRRNRDDDDEGPRKKPPARGRERAEEPQPASAKGWKGFGTGSSLAKWGMWIEFLGVTAGTVLITYLLIGLIEHPGEFAATVEDFGGPAIFLPWFLSSLLGTLLVWLGRARMMGIPSGTGAKKVFLGAFLFTLIRLFAVAGSAILAVMAVTEWKSDPGGAGGRVALAMLVWVVGVPFWLLADLSTIPAMAIAGGAIPSHPLRRKAGWVAFILQLLVIGYVVLVVLLYFGSDRIDLDDLRPRQATPTVRTGQVGRLPTTPTTRTTTTSSVSDKTKTVLMAGAGISVLLHFIYTALYASLYGAGARAAREAREAEEAAEDEDV